MQQDPKLDTYSLQLHPIGHPHPPTCSSLHPPPNHMDPTVFGLPAPEKQKLWNTCGFSPVTTCMVLLCISRRETVAQMRTYSFMDTYPYVEYDIQEIVSIYPSIWVRTPSANTYYVPIYGNVPIYATVPIQGYDEYVVPNPSMPRAP